MATGVSFWERIASVYDGGVDYILGNNLQLIVLDKLKKEQQLGRTVEFGCGTGYFTPLLAELSESVVATDITESMLDRTRERVKGLSTVTVLREDCEKTTFPPASFDTAFLGFTFQLVDGPMTVAEIQRLLKPGGRLILAIPTMEGLRLSDKLLCIMRNYRTYGTIKPPGTKLYTYRSLPPLITQGGFKVLDVEQLTDPAHPGGFSGLYVRAVKM
jgi:ubiquinone/menaquinone biosynthesis C-methylase UbiE